MDLRPSLAGTWYPQQKSRLQDTLDQLFRSTSSEQARHSDLVGLLAPHAGMRYCGSVAAHAFQQVPETKPSQIVIIAPLHRYFRAPLLTSAYDGYQTPLGPVPIDHEFVDQLRHHLTRQAGMELVALKEDQEHAIEVELPYLQWCYGDCEIVPIMMAQQSQAVVASLVTGLRASLAAGDCLIIASSDLSHYKSRMQATNMDHLLLEKILDIEPEAVIRAVEQHAAYACGVGPIAVMLSLSQSLGANQARLLKYATSAEVTGDPTSVVGYASAGVYRTDPGDRLVEN